MRFERGQPSLNGAPRPPRSGRFGAKYPLFAVLGAMTVFVAWNNERFFLDPQAPEWAHYDAVKWQLLPHGIGGTLTLALGALQFSERLRRRNLRIHRFAGRI